MNLRPYQQACRRAILDAYRQGVRRALVVLPTGTGKTVIFASLPQYFRMKNRMLVLAHREELLEQAREKFHRAIPNLPVGIEQAAQRAVPGDRVVLASVSTLGRKGSTRLQALNPDEFKLVVVDEAHHAVAPTYRRILDYLGLFEKGTEKLLLGFTATPVRGDRRGLQEVFERIVFSRSIGDMIAAGYLCDLRGYRVSTETDLSDIRTRHGDFVTRELSRRVNDEARNATVVAAYLKLVPTRKGLVFCVDVAHARALARAFQEAGIPARAIWGEMPKVDRAAVLADFRQGRIRVITNCNVLSEGFDEPAIETVLMARPTQSPLLYAQMIGRGTRLHPGKKFLTVIDIVDNTRRHRLICLPLLFGLNADFDLQGAPVRQLQLRLQEAARRFPGLDFSQVRSPEELALRIERVRLIRPELAEEVLRYSRFCWVKMPDDSYWLDLGGRRWMKIRRNLLDHFELTLDEELVEIQKSLPRAFRRADRLVRERAPELVRLLGQDLRWRADPATDKQRALLRQMGLNPSEDLTKGEAALMISSAKARRSSAHGIRGKFRGKV